MAGNKKPRKASAPVKRMTDEQKSSAAIALINNEKAQMDKAKLKIFVLEAMNRIIKREGKMFDLSQIHYRVATGQYILLAAFKEDEARLEAEKVFNTALDVVSIIAIRALTEGVMAITEDELSFIRNAFDVTEDLIRYTPIDELKMVMRKVSNLHVAMVEENCRAYPTEVLERDAMVKQLASEYRDADLKAAA